MSTFNNLYELWQRVDYVDRKTKQTRSGKIVGIHILVVDGVCYTVERDLDHRSGTYQEIITEESIVAD